MIETSIYVGDLRSHVGSRRDIHIVVPGESFSTNVAQIIDDITCDLTLESVPHGIVIHGLLQGNYSAQCSYGLIDIVEPIRVTVNNELFEEVRLRERMQEEDEDVYRFKGEDLDIEQMLRDILLTSLPLAPVCGHGPENCAVCSAQVTPFIAKDLGNISDHVIGGIDDVITEKKNPWAALDQLKFDDED